MADDISKERFHSTADAGETAYELNSGAKIVWKDDGGGASISATDNGIVIDFPNASIEFLSSGAQVLEAGDSTGVGEEGNTTLNTPSGQSLIEAGQAAIVVTNSMVEATSIVLAVLQGVDATLTSLKSCVPAGGSFTITGNTTATADVQVGWVVFNGVVPE